MPDSFETRRLAMMRENTEQIAALRTDANSKKLRAALLRTERDICRQKSHHARAAELTAEAMNLDYEAGRILQQLIPRCESEGKSIDSGSHPTLRALFQGDAARARADKELQAQKLRDAVANAKSALIQHLAEHSTVSTLPLLQALQDAETAAAFDHEVVLSDLLRALTPQRAA
jgi:hypothetical protein